MQYVLLPHTLFRGTRLFCHITYFMAVNVVVTHRLSWQSALFLWTILRGNRLNYHVNYFVSICLIASNCFMTVCVVATYIVSLHKAMLQHNCCSNWPFCHMQKFHCYNFSCNKENTSWWYGITNKINIWLLSPERIIKI
jgi:hypothetical protein